MKTEQDVGLFQRSDLVVRELTAEEIEWRALYDASTEVYNLRYLLRNMFDEMVRCQTFNRPVTVMVISIHNYKNIGLEYGTLALDGVMSVAATCIVRTCRAVDVVGRFSEDKFLVICPETSLQTAGQLAEKVRATFEHIRIAHQWHTIRLQANVGMSQYPDHGCDVESLIGHADFATDLLAKDGGNGVRISPINSNIQVLAR